MDEVQKAYKQSECSWGLFVYALESVVWNYEKAKQEIKAPGALLRLAAKDLRDHKHDELWGMDWVVTNPKSRKTQAA